MKLTKHRKCQIILSCIPLFGFLAVFFNILFYLKRQYGCGYWRLFLFYLFCIPIMIIGCLICWLIYYYLIYTFSSTMTILATVTLIVFAVIFIGVGFAFIGMEKLYIRKFFNDLPKNQTEKELL